MELERRSLSPPRTHKSTHRRTHSSLPRPQLSISSHTSYHALLPVAPGHEPRTRLPHSYHFGHGAAPSTVP